MNRISQNQLDSDILVQEFGSFKDGKCHELNFVNIAVRPLFLLENMNRAK